MNYYIIQVKTLKEEEYIQRVEKQLEFRKIEQSFFFPKREMTIRKQGKKTKQKLPLFASYIFIQTEKIDRELYSILKTTPNFYRFLPNNQDIQKVEGKDLLIIQHFLKFGKTIEASKVFFDENEKIIVAEGPLKGIEGLIIKVDKRKKRVKVLLELSKTPFAFDLAFEEIEKGNVHGSKL